MNINKDGIIKVGIGMGGALAITLSWSVSKSIAWACLHGILGWIYVVYYALKYGNL